MTHTEPCCRQCGRKISPSVSNRCMYCGAVLPEAHRLNADGRAQLLKEKLAQFRHNEDNAESIISELRRDFSIPEKKSRKSRRQKSKDAKAAALTAIAAITTITCGGGGSGS